MSKVGDKVFCIDGSFHPSICEWANHIPVEGRVYTIRSIHRCPHTITREDGVGYRLMELKNPGHTRDKDVCFSDWRFIDLEELSSYYNQEIEEKSPTQKKAESIASNNLV
jgi:hypothetical protein